MLDRFLGQYENSILLGDFNSQIKEDKLSEFCDQYSLKNLISEATCYKNVVKPTSIDLILTNREKGFHESRAIETGISDFHKIILTVLKTYFMKKPPKLIKYRNYKSFNEELLESDLKNKLNETSNGAINYDVFKNIFLNLLNKFTPIKENLVRGNNAPFMNKVLSKSDDNSNTRKFIRYYTKYNKKYNKNKKEV